jgi:hypothetical protein
MNREAAVTKDVKYLGWALLTLTIFSLTSPAINVSTAGSNERRSRESSGIPINGVYWKYDNKVSPDGRFLEYDLWLEFRSDGTFTETVAVKWSPTGNRYSGQSQSRGQNIDHVSTGKYKIFPIGRGDYDDWVGELVYDDGSMAKRMTIPHRLTLFMPPEGFNLSGDPNLRNPDEMNWKRTRAVGVRPTPFENF